jgi:Holliday junction resolvase RusA-like endonuclease
VSEIRFVVSGPVVPWKRTTLYRGKRLTPKRQREYQRRVKGEAYGARIRQEWPMNARYVLRIDVHEHDARKRDLDNCLKTISDALNGVLWDDDYQVDGIVALRREICRHSPRVEVYVRTLHNSDRLDDGAM